MISRIHRLDAELSKVSAEVPVAIIPALPTGLAGSHVRKFFRHESPQRSPREGVSGVGPVVDRVPELHGVAQVVFAGSVERRNVIAKVFDRQSAL
jgi:hypothetical protein